MNATAEDIAPESAPSLADGPISRVITIPPAPVEDPPEQRVSLPIELRTYIEKFFEDGEHKLEPGSNFGAMIERMRLFHGPIGVGDDEDAGDTVSEKRRKDLAKDVVPLRDQIRALRSSINRLCGGRSGQGQRTSVRDFFEWWRGERWDLTFAPFSWTLSVKHVERVYRDWQAGALPDDDVVRERLRWAQNEIDRHKRDRKRTGEDAELTVEITAESRTLITEDGKPVAGWQMPEGVAERYAPLLRGLMHVHPTHREVLREFCGPYGQAWKATCPKYGQAGALYWRTPTGAKLFEDAQAARARKGQPAIDHHPRYWIQSEAFREKAKKTEAGPGPRSVLDHRTRMERSRVELDKQTERMLQEALGSLLQAMKDQAVRGGKVPGLEALREAAEHWRAMKEGRAAGKARRV